MNETPLYIRNHEAVVSAFGYWPSFHDASVVAFEYGGSRVTLSLHAQEITSRTDERGYYVRQKHHIVRFAFAGVTEADLSRFIAENILLRLGFSSPQEFEAAGRFVVDLDSAIGAELCGSFTATAGEVIAVLPCDEHAQPASPTAGADRAGA